MDVPDSSRYAARLYTHTYTGAVTENQMYAVVFGLGVPLLFLLAWGWYKWMRYRSKRDKALFKSDFSTGMQNLQSKYGRFLQRKDERLLSETPGRDYARAPSPTSPKKGLFAGRA